MQHTIEQLRLVNLNTCCLSDRESKPKLTW